MSIARHDDDCLEVATLTTIRSWRVPTWLIVAWTLVFGLLLVGNVMSPGQQDAVAFFLSSSGPASLQTWAIGAIPLGLVWYVTRPGIPRRRIGLAVLATLIALGVLLAYRQRPEAAPFVAPATSGQFVEIAGGQLQP